MQTSAKPAKGILLAIAPKGAMKHKMAKKMDEDHMGDMEVAASELIRAIKAGDASAVAEALHAAMACSENEY